MYNAKTYLEYFAELSLEEKSVAPKELFSEGDFSLLSEGVRVSVVGSRNVSSEGQKRTEIITKELVQRGIIVVSGLADGVDTIAHQTAIKNNGKTIAVLGTPLDKCYPAKNKELLSIIKKEHLAISQFSKGSNVYQSNFPTRNKTMALISDATLIIEATEKSGTRHQAWEAIRLGRTVLLLESLVTSNELTWPKELLNYGAVVLTRKNCDSILNELKENSFVSM